MRASSALLVGWWSLLGASAGAAETTVTLRLGEQDTCRLRNVTKLEWDDKAGLSRIHFDVAGLPKGATVRRALLRFWADGRDAAIEKAWGFGRWREEGFDGFKVYDGPAPAEKPLDVRYPFHTPTCGCFEFDVTPAVRRWLAQPGANRGLCANFRFPVAPDGKPQAAWQRPYLQVTCTGPNPNRPAQPTALKAFCRSGQVFVTWKQGGHEGAFFEATCRVYLHGEPITAANLDRAECLGEVHRLSQLNYRRTLTARGGDYGPWRYYVQAAGQEPHKKGETRQARQARALKLIPKRFNFVIDADWPKRIDGGRFLNEPKASDKVQIHQGPPLADDCGLFVHTVRKARKAYLAVTSVAEGNENRQDVSPGNSLARPIDLRVARPQPVLQAVFTANGPEGYGKVGKFQVREYVYWEGGSDGLHSEASTPLCFVFRVPRRWVGLGFDHGPEADRLFPPWVLSNAKVAGYSVSYWDGRGLVMDSGYVPPTRRAPFPPGAAPNMRWPEYGEFYYGSRGGPGPARAGGGYCVRDVYGYVTTINSGLDPRRAVVQPFFERRRLFELDYVLGAFPADANYVAAVGEAAAWTFGLHHAERIGCIKCEQERPWRSPAGSAGRDRLVGLPDWKLKNDRGANVWQWNDPLWLARQFPRRDWPCLSNCQSPNYNSADNWTAMGFPQFYLQLAAAKRCAQLWWCDIGDAPHGKFLAVPLNQAYPVLTHVTCCETPRPRWKDEPRGTLNGYVVWHRPTRPWMSVHKPPKGKPQPPAPPGRTVPYVDRRGSRTVRWAAVPLDLVDSPARFEVALRIGEDGLMLNGQSVPPCRAAFGAADVTPRRLQRFRVEKHRQYRWRNVKVATGQLLQAGTIAPDEIGLLTVPQFLVDKDVLGNKLIIESAPAGPAPAVDAAQTVRVTYFRSGRDRRTGRNEQVEELAYGQYVSRCRRPELVPVARGERVFHIDDFVNTKGFRGAGLYSMWGGGFDDALHFPRDGRYRVEVETTKSCFQNGAWPILGFFVDDRSVGERLLDGNEPATHAWWIDLAKGRHRVKFQLMNNVFNEPVPRHGDQSPKPDRGFTLVGVRFVPLDEPPAPPAAGQTYQTRIRARSVVTAPGMAVAMKAHVLDAWGRPMAKTKARWQASAGAAITPGGLFRAARPGRYTVTAAAGGKRDAVLVRVHGEGWLEDFDDEWADGWRPVGRAKDAELAPRWMVTRRTGFIGTLVQRNRQTEAPHVIVWQGASDFGDVLIRADSLPGSQGQPVGDVQGVVFGYRDDRNYWRFERGSGGKTDELRLVRRTNLRETVLASVERDIEPIAMDRRTYPSFAHWSDRWRSEVKPLAVDRFEVELRGRRVVAKLNGRQVFDLNAPEAARGTIGLYCAGGVVFDNILVKPLR